jgi:hypothetical protein
VNNGEIVKKLHEMAEQNLFGEGSWPADEEYERAYWKFFEIYLATKVLNSEQWQLSDLSIAIDLLTMESFIGVGNPDFFLAPFGWDKSDDYDKLEEQLDRVSRRHGDELVKHYIRGAYFRYCEARGITPFQMFATSDDLPVAR